MSVCSSQEQKRYKRRSCGSVFIVCSPCPCAPRRSRRRDIREEAAGSVFIVCSPCPCAPRRSRRRDIREEAAVLCLSCVLRVRVLLAGAEEEI